MSLALVFPGQGSQHVGMASELAARVPVAARTLEEADDVLGVRLSRIMFEGPDAELTATRNAQPALLAHSIAVLRAVTDRIAPVALAAGHSLGEFSAHVAAGTLSFEDALRAVRVRGELMHEAGLVRPGTMAAVLGLDDHVVEDVCTRVEPGQCVAANFNAPGQIVISGDRAGVESAAEMCRAEGAKRVIPLNVSGAFHSPLMEPAAEGLSSHLKDVTFRDPDYPVIANVTAKAVTSGALSRDLLVKQLTSPVRWTTSVSTMVASGVDTFMEIGPGNVLCALNRRNARGVKCTSLGEPSDLDALEAA